MKKIVSETIFGITCTINRFCFMPEYLLALSLCLKLTLDILCRNMKILQENMFLFSFLNQARAMLYFHDNSSYKQIDENLLFSIILASIFGLLLLTSIAFLNLNTEKKKNIIISASKVIILINYVLSSLIFSFSWNLLVSCILQGKIYFMPIFLLLLALNLVSNAFLQIFMCTWMFKKNSILSRNYSKLEVIKFLLLRVIQIYFSIRRGSQTYHQFAATSLLLLIIDSVSLRSYFQQIYYYHKKSQHIHLKFLVIEIVFNLLIVVNVLQIQLLNKNIIFGLLFGSFFMILATQSYYNYFKFQIITKQLKEISNEKEAIMYMRFIDELIQNTNNRHNQLLVTEIIACHIINCIDLDCQCKIFPKKSKSYQKINPALIKRFFSCKFKRLFNQFPTSPQVLATWLNFSLDICTEYTNYIPELQSFFLSKRTISLRETLQFLQGSYSFEKFIEQDNNKEKSIDIESTFMIMDKLKQINQEMIKSAHNLSERWRIICHSFCTINSIQTSFNSVLSNMQKMNQYWQFIKRNDIKSIEVFTIFYLYYFIIIDQPIQYKSIQNLIQNLTEYLKGIKYIDLSNLRQLIFNENACNVQTPISYDAIGIIKNCTNNSESVLGVSKKQLQGKNIKYLMPSTLAKCHDSLLENWMKTGTKRSINKIKRVYGLRGNIYKELFACDLYLKLYSNTQTHKLSFVVSIVLRNSTDYIIINPDMIVEGYGLKLKNIMPRSIINQPFTKFNSNAYQFWLSANDNEVSRITIIKQIQENRNIIKIHKLKILISQYVMAGKKFLLLKILTISKPSYIQHNQQNSILSSTTMIAENRFSFEKDRTIQPLHGSIELTQSSKSQNKGFQVHKKNKNYNNNVSSSVASSIESSNYSFAKIRLFCLEQFYDSNKIKKSCLKKVAIIITLCLIFSISLQWFQIDNSFSKIVFYGDITKKSNRENYIFILEALLFNQMIDIKQKYVHVPKQQFDKIISMTKFINIRANDILSTNFLIQKQQKNLIDQGISTQSQTKTSYTLDNDSVSIEFIQFAKLKQAKIQRFLYGQINQQTIETTFSQLAQNWGSIVQLVLTSSNKSFQSLLNLYLIDKFKMYGYGVTIFILLLAIIIIVSWHNFKLIQRKTQILLINQNIPHKYSEMKRKYYMQVKEMLKIQNMQILYHFGTQSGQENFRSKSMVSIQHKQNYLVLFLITCLFFVVMLTPQIALLISANQIFTKQEQIGSMIRQLLQLQQIIFATYTSVHYQIVSQKDSDVLNQFISNFTDIKSSINQKFQSLYIRYNSLENTKFERIQKLVQMHLCQLLKPMLNKWEMQFCLEFDESYTLTSKGLFLSMEQFIIYTKQMISNMLKKQSPNNSQFSLIFQPSIYFIFLGYSHLNLVAVEDLSQFVLKSFQIINKLLILYIMVCVLSIGFWMVKSLFQIRSYCNIFGYAMLYPLQLIKYNKAAFRILQQNILKSF